MNEFEILITIILGSTLVVLCIVMAMLLNEYLKPYNHKLETHGKEREAEKGEEAEET